jgi:hypothetical protein
MRIALQVLSAYANTIRSFSGGLARQMNAALSVCQVRWEGAKSGSPRTNDLLSCPQKMDGSLQGVGKMCFNGCIHLHGVSTWNRRIEVAYRVVNSVYPPTWYVSKGDVGTKNGVAVSEGRFVIREQEEEVGRLRHWTDLNTVAKKRWIASDHARGRPMRS